jgi:hypothetical protein
LAQTVAREYDFTRVIRRRLLGMVLVSVALFFAVYVVFVRTADGQQWENAAVNQLHRSMHPVWTSVADRYLSFITNATFALALAGIVVIGLVRKRFALTAAAIATVLGSLLTAELLQHYLLSRPALIWAPSTLTGNSFPSGHTTIAMGVTLGFIMIVPSRLRIITALIAYAATALVASFTIIAGWHRPSDTFGADFLVLTMASVVIALLAQRGRIRRLPAYRRSAGYTATLLFLGFVGVGLVGYGLTLYYQAAARHFGRYGDLAILAYRSGISMAAGMSALTVLALLLLVRDVDLENTSARKSFHSFGTRTGLIKLARSNVR